MDAILFDPLALMYPGNEYGVGATLDIDRNDRVPYTLSSDPEPGRRIVGAHFKTTQPSYGVENLDQDRKDPTLNKDVVNEETPGFHFSLSPFSFVYRNLTVPVIGLIDVVLRPAERVAMGVTSLIYHAIPVGSRTRLAMLFQLSFGLKHAPRPPKVEADYCYVCASHYVTNKFTGKADSGCGCSLMAAFGFDVARVKSCTTGEVIPSWSLTKGKPMDVWPTLFATEGWLFDVAEEVCDCVTDDTINPGVGVIPVSTPDGLGHIPAEKRWRASSRGFGARCETHHPQQMHGIHPELFRLMRGFDDQGTTLLRPCRLVIETIYRWRQYVSMLNGESYFIIATSGARGVDLGNVDVTRTIFIVTTKASLVELQARIGDALKWFMVPTLNGMRSLAGWRYILAISHTSPITFHAINHTGLMPRQRRDADLLISLDLGIRSMATGHIWPMFMGNAVFPPYCTKVDLRSMINSFATTGWIYGWDEIFPAYNENPIIVTAGTAIEPQMCSPILDRQMTGGPLVVMALASGYGHVSEAVAFKFDRPKLGLVAKAFQRVRVPFMGGLWAAFSDPRPIPKVPKVIQSDFSELYEEFHILDTRAFSASQVQLRGRHATCIAEELSNEHNGVTFFTYGSRGDRVPIIALAKHLASCSIRARVIHLLTDEEGREVVRRLERQEPQDFSLFMTALERVSATKFGFKIAPWQFASVVDGTFDLSPPSDIVYPLRLGGGWLKSLFMRLLHMLSNPTMRVGAYTRPGWVPRSADGLTFLKHTKNIGLRPIGQVRGSGAELPLTATDIPEVLGEDHPRQFSYYKKIVCAGGAGTVQTAAASGCIVEVTTNVFDRNYRDQYDAGIGVNPGSDPDNLLLALSRHRSYFLGLWLRRHIFQPWKLLAWYGLGGWAMGTFRAFIIITLFSRSARQTELFTDPLLYLLGVVGYPLRSWRNLATAWMVARVIDNALELAERDYYFCVYELIKYCSMLASSPLGCYVAWHYSLGSGLLATIFIDFIGPSVMQELLTWQRMVVLTSVCSPTYQIQYTLHQWYGIPFFHVELVDIEHNRAWGLRSTRSGDVGYKDVDQSLVTIRLPTFIEIAMPLETPLARGPYGLLWNCYTAMWVSLDLRGAQLGIGGLPIKVYGSVVGIIAAVGASFGACVVTIVDTIPSTFGLEPVQNFPLTVLTQSLRALVDKLFDHPATPLQTLVGWAAGLH